MNNNEMRHYRLDYCYTYLTIYIVYKSHNDDNTWSLTHTIRKLNNRYSFFWFNTMLEKEGKGFRITASNNCY